MFELYGDAGKIFTTNIRAKHPIILGLFSGAGGRFILYRPGMPPLEAPSVPLSYQLLKSVGHSTMAVSEVVLPYLDNPNDTSWKGSMLSYRSRMQSALDTLAALPMQADWRENNRLILQNNIAFMDDCVAKGVIAYSSLQAFAKKQAPLLKLNVEWAAETQVAHWMTVLADWKKMIGADWDKTYAASNTIYVARQNNVLYSVLAQFFGPEALNNRLILIETVSFTTTPEDMLESLTRIVADRSVGELFFGNYYLMDYELMGGSARRAIIAENAKRGTTPFLPPSVPFGRGNGRCSSRRVRVRRRSTTSSDVTTAGVRAASIGAFKRAAFRTQSRPILAALTPSIGNAATPDCRRPQASHGGQRARKRRACAAPTRPAAYRVRLTTAPLRRLHRYAMQANTASTITSARNCQPGRSAASSLRWAASLILMPASSPFVTMGHLRLVVGAPFRWRPVSPRRLRRHGWIVGVCRARTLIAGNPKRLPGRQKTAVGGFDDGAGGQQAPRAPSKKDPRIAAGAIPQAAREGSRTGNAHRAAARR